MLRKSFFSSLLNFLTVLLTLVAIIAAFCSALTLADFLKGYDYSPLGIPIYDNRGGAFAVGFIVYPLYSSLLLFLINKTIGRNNFLAHDFGVPIFLISLIFYLPLLLTIISL